jgi:uncharacterized protein YdhG (YjbR/CyaY superfamily)
MPRSGFESVDDYIAAQPESARSALQRVRAIIRKALPGAEELISYQIPAYRLHGRVLLYFGGWKKHYSIFPAGATARVLEAFRNELAPYGISKGAIRFPLTEPVPVKLIGEIARFRAQEAAQRTAAKPAAAKKR